jgi:hypothetical protein
MDPELATRLGQQLAEKLRPLLGGASPTAVVAPALGGVLVAHEVARGFSCRGLFTERQDGVMTLRRGFEIENGEPVVVVEDVITTGGSTREVLECVRARGGVGSRWEPRGPERGRGRSGPAAGQPAPARGGGVGSGGLPPVRQGKPPGKARVASRGLEPLAELGSLTRPRDPPSE